MITTAGYFRAAGDAGLKLIGQDGKRPVFAGSDLKLSVFRYYLVLRDVHADLKIENLYAN